MRSFVLIYSPKCIEPVGESKSDYEICCLIAEKLGPSPGKHDLLDKFTEGRRSIEEQIKWLFEKVGALKYISWEEFKEKGYWFFPVDPGWGFRKSRQILFCEVTELCPLDTPSGKIEFYSERLARNFPGDYERPPTISPMEKLGGRPFGSTGKGLSILISIQSFQMENACTTR